MKRGISLLVAVAVYVFLGIMPAAAQHGRPSSGPGSGAGAQRPTPRPTGQPSNPGRPDTAGKPATAGKGIPATAKGKDMNDLLQQNTKLSSKLQTLTGMPAQDACSGFKNLGACVSAAHVSKNLGLDFATLRGKVTGTGAVSLGKAVKQLNPNVDAKAEVKKANKQTKDDLESPQT